MADFGWPVLIQNEITLPSNGHIKWSVKNGATVRAGQLMAISTLPSEALNSIDSASSSQSQSQSQLMGADPSSKAGSEEAPAKTNIIRARRINRKVKPMAASTGNPSSADGSNGSTSTALGSAKEDGSSTTVSASKNGSSFLGQYLKSAVKTQQKASDSNPSDKGSINENPNATNIFVSQTKMNTKPIDNSELRAHLDGFLKIYLTPQCRKDPNNNQELVYVLGIIEPCKHPAIIDGLCAVCGQPADSKSTSNSSGEPQDAHNNGNGNSSTAQSTNSAMAGGYAHPYDDQHRLKNPASKNDNGSGHGSLTLSGGVTISISSEYALKFSSDSSQSLRAAKKLNLVLDIDHTLLHATADRRASSWIGKSEDVHTLLLPMMEGHPLQQQKNGGGNSNWMQPHYVKLRPNLAESLCGVMDQYEVSIYTAGTRLYAEKCADLISRHVADYQRRIGRKEDGGGGDGDACLDEGDLFMLRDNVARTKDRVSWYKSRKERQDYVDKMNQQLQIQKKESEEKIEAAAAAAAEKQKDDELVGAETKASDSDDEPHMMAGSEEDIEMTLKANQRKRKRVTFSLPDVDGNDNSDNIRELQAAKKSKEPNDGTELESASKILKEVEQKLEQAEKKEAEAQNMRKKIFGSRIISRTDVGDLGRDVKSLKRVFPCGGMMAAIVDDREDVWANATDNSTGRKGEPPDNLLFVRPYHWGPFQKFADVNNSAGEDITLQSKSGIDEDITSLDESHERQLLWTADTLRRIHDRFYDASLSEEQRDKLTVPGILKQMRYEVFGNAKTPAKFIFSGLVPLHKQRTSTEYIDAPRPLIVRYAEDLGAKIENELTSDSTHVIAARDGTDKILRARKIPGCAVVKVTWLMECYWSCTLQIIDSHILGPKPIPVPPSSGPKRSILLTESDSSEEDDDGFFDDFEKEMESKE